MIHKNEECCQCLEITTLIDVPFMICGADGPINIPLCVSCRMNINVNDDWMYSIPYYYWKHMKSYGRRS